MLAVTQVGYDDISHYLDLNDEETDLPWIQSVTDLSLVKCMMHNGSHGRNRCGYGLFDGDHMVGYAVVDERHQILDLMHITEEFRGMGYGTEFLRHLDVSHVVVDPRNEAAIALYEKMGYTLEFIEDLAA